MRGAVPGLKPDRWLAWSEGVGLLHCHNPELEAAAEPLPPLKKGGVPRPTIVAYSFNAADNVWKQVRKNELISTECITCHLVLG